ncbi:hypothetical protein HanRHA438_Chr15g0688441 [Helianthus annuus]|uniref:Uncharacterized protein n=1 Tax=Helianthus annuus TaxID=4232 RepID=A0A9K3DYP1_HELAN|nr:hypothetical protein HanXRQr2_Chr15g0676011 [Helianthus annuus]KAJ0450022.1 hypothetical protein HanHA300_Chr15g0551821 [Helianthus annuus]KAJ0471765.1 hypothetical protein HanHA89_Chr15g0599671 [Helianthus annuus]KAJ0843171.1 hypothetical protein HanRHA438_Chr15g0688441 [Helianthus annuus]
MGQSEEAELNELMAAIRNLSLQYAILKCIKITDRGLEHVIVKCSMLWSKEPKFLCIKRRLPGCSWWLS